MPNGSPPWTSTQELPADLGGQDGELASSAVSDLIPLREVRAAVTMVGGTSLAIYENGVAQELFAMCEGSGVYGLLKQITCSHAYVDILSGTSAGGINTIFLSAALTQRRSLAPTRETWIRLGGIDDLLQDPYNTRARSLLRGNDYYFPELVRAFEQVASGVSLSNHRNFPSGLLQGQDGMTHYTDLDLFVTGTYLEGRPSTFFDARSQPLLGVDHQGVFHLKHRPHRRESHFHPDLKEVRAGGDWAALTRQQRQERIAERLARISRTTSSLPALFEPSAVSDRLMNGVIDLPSGKNRDVSFMGDGGYLNNRPLNLVLQRAYRRPSQRKVTRKLFFVEPVAEDAPLVSERDPEEPSALEHVSTYNRVRGEQSLTRYFKDIATHNSKARRIEETLNAARRDAGTPLTDYEVKVHADLRARDLGIRIISLWRRGLGLEGFDTVMAGPTDSIQQRTWERRRDARTLLHFGEILNPSDPCVSNLERLFSGLRPAGSDDWLDLIDVWSLGRRANRAIDEVLLGMHAQADELIKDLLENRHAHSRQNRGERERESELTRARKQISCALRRLYHLRATIDLILENLEEIWSKFASTPKFRAVLTALQGQLQPASQRDALEKALRTLIGYLEDSAAILLGGSYSQIADAASNVPVEPGLTESAHQLEQLRKEMENRSLEAWERFYLESDSKLEPIQTTLLLDLDRAISEALSHAAAAYGNDKAPECPRSLLQIPNLKSPLARDYLRSLDARLFAMERASLLPNPTTVELVHISARSVQTGLAEKDEDKKLAGDILMNLGGFLKRSWRVNDIMWGRLDASSAIIETLFEPERLSEVLMDPSAGPAILRAAEHYIDFGELLSDPQAAHLSNNEPDLLGQYVRAEAYDERKQARVRLELHKEHIQLAHDRKETDLNKVRADLRRAIETDLQSASAPTNERDPDRDLKYPYALLLHALRLRHQMEILCHEVPEVVAEAMSEHCEWLGARLALKARSFMDEQGAIEVHRAAARARDQGQIAGGNPDDEVRQSLRTAAREWIRKHFQLREETSPEIVRSRFASYRVGEEEVTRDIPPLVNTRRITQAILVALNVLRRSLPSEVQQKGVGAVVIRGVIAPTQVFLGAFYRLIWLLSQNRAAEAALQTIIWGILILGGPLLLSGHVKPGASLDALRVLVGVALLVAFVTGMTLYKWLFGLAAGLLCGAVISGIMASPYSGFYWSPGAPWSWVGPAAVAAIALVLLSLAFADWKVLLVEAIVLTVAIGLTATVDSAPPWIARLQPLPVWSRILVFTSLVAGIVIAYYAQRVQPIGLLEMERATSRWRMRGILYRFTSKACATARPLLYSGLAFGLLYGVALSVACWDVKPEYARAQWPLWINPLVIEWAGALCAPLSWLALAAIVLEWIRSLGLLAALDNAAGTTQPRFKWLHPVFFAIQPAVTSRAASLRWGIVTVCSVYALVGFLIRIMR